MNRSIRRYAFPLPIILFLIVFFGCQAENTPDIPTFETVALLGNEPLNEWDIRHEFFQTISNKVDENPDAEHLLNSTLFIISSRGSLYLDAVDKGYLGDDFRTRLEVLKRVIVARNFQEIGDADNPFDPTDQETADMEPPKWDRLYVSQLTTVSRDEALVALEDLKFGFSFSEIVAERSIEPATKKSGGKIAVPLVPTLPLMFDNEVLDKLYQYQQNDLTEPIRTRYGWSIFHIDKREAISPEEIEGYRANLRAKLREKKRIQWVLEVQSKYPLVIHEEYLQESLNAQSPPGNRVVAVVGKYKIPWADLFQFAQWERGFDPENKDLKSWNQLVERMTSSIPFYLEARAKGYATKPEVLALLKNWELKQVGERYLEDLKKKVVLSDRELWDFYRSKVFQNSGPEAAGLYEVVDLRSKDLETAEGVFERLSHSDPWQQVLDENNLFQVTTPGEEIRKMFITQLSWQMYQDLGGVSPGQAIGPFKLPDGQYSILIMKTFSPGEIKEFEETKDAVEATLRSKTFDEQQNELFNRNRKKYPLTVVDQLTLLDRMNDWMVEAEENRVQKKTGAPHMPTGH